MNENHKELMSITLSVAIVVLTVFIIHRFLTPLLWAAIITIATFPLYKRWRKMFDGHANLAAFSFTALLGLILLIPLSWLVSLLITESQLFINYLQVINREGGAPPEILAQIPFVGHDIIAYWTKNIGQPGKVKILLSNLHLSLTPASYYIKQIGTNLAHRGIQLGFTILSLFFFYRDGEKLFLQVNHVGEVCLGERWFRYADKLPAALRSTVNGTVVVGLGVGLLMGLCYLFVGFPAPTLTGFLTAIAAMIPFVVPLVFLIVALILAAYGSFIAALVVLIWGTIVMFVADHFIKPVLIGGAIELPFLAVLFGILGGVETLGLLGLFLGPIIMVLFITLWTEPQLKKLS